MVATAHVLLVDDEPDILAALQSFLRDALPAVQVHTAGSGADGLALLQSQPVDLVLSDYKMPGMDGLEFLAKARELSDSPRILMTAFPDMDLAIRALNEGRIQHFLAKPLDPDMVRDVLTALVAERRAKSQREAALPRSRRWSTPTPTSWSSTTRCPAWTAWTPPAASASAGPTR